MTVQVENGEKSEAKWNGRNAYFALETESVTVSTVMGQARSDSLRVT